MCVYNAKTVEQPQANTLRAAYKMSDYRGVG